MVFLEISIHSFDYCMHTLTNYESISILDWCWKMKISFKMAGEHEDQFDHLINYLSHCHCLRKVDILSDTLLRHVLCNVHDCPPTPTNCRNVNCCFAWFFLLTFLNSQKKTCLKYQQPFYKVASLIQTLTSWSWLLHVSLKSWTHSWHEMGYWPSHLPPKHWTSPQNTGPPQVHFLTTIRLGAKSMEMWILYKNLYNIISNKWKIKMKSKENKP